METIDPLKSLSRRQERNLLEAAAAELRAEYDNPRRGGCPERAELKSLASRRSPLAESANLIDHIGTCSPCFAEYSRYRAAQERRVRTLSVAACAAAAAVLYFGVPHALERIRSGPPPAEVARPPETTPETPAPQRTDVALDLRYSGVKRSGEREPEDGQDLPRLPRARLSLSIQLPIGSEDGVYEVALADSEDVVAAASGEAKLREFVVILTVDLDLAHLSPGVYELRTRRTGTQWNTYYVLLE
jgi:hypothetical protein